MGRVQHPDWLYKRLAERNSTCRQRRIDDMFSLRAERPVTSPSGAIESTAADIELLDIEDVAGGGGAKKPTMSVVTTRTGRQNDENSAPSSSAKRKHSEMVINISEKSHIRLLLLTFIIAITRTMRKRFRGLNVIGVKCSERPRNLRLE